MTALLLRLRRQLAPVALPLLLLAAWHIGVRVTGTRLIPLPQDVALMLYDFAFGGIYNDAYSKTLHIHLWKSVTRVYGGFFSAAALAIPLGLLIGRIFFANTNTRPICRMLLPSWYCNRRRCWDSSGLFKKSLSA